MALNPDNAFIQENLLEQKDGTLQARPGRPRFNPQKLAFPMTEKKTVIRLVMTLNSKITKGSRRHTKPNSRKTKPRN
jgi:hypothetical protein